MSHEIKICLDVEKGKEKRYLTGNFEDQEWSDLIEFVRYAKDLQSTEIVRQGGHGKLNLNYTEGNGLSYSIDLPPEDQILALLHRLRPFILNNESTNFFKVCNHISRRFEDEQVRNFIKSLREYYSGKRLQAKMQVRSNEVLINSEKTLLKWLNAHEYHKDKDKQTELEILHQILPLEASRAFFMMMLYDKVKAIFVLANFVCVMTGEQETFECALR